MATTLLDEVMGGSAAPAAAELALARLAGHHPGVMARLEADPVLATAVVTVVATSRSMTQLLAVDPEAIDVLADLDRRRPMLAATPDELVAWKRREYLRIAARDLLGLEGLGPPLRGRRPARRPRHEGTGRACPGPQGPVRPGGQAWPGRHPRRRVRRPDPPAGARPPGRGTPLADDAVRARGACGRGLRRPGGRRRARRGLHLPEDRGAPPATRRRAAGPCGAPGSRGAGSPGEGHGLPGRRHLHRPGALRRRAATPSGRRPDGPRAALLPSAARGVRRPRRPHRRSHRGPPQRLRLRGDRPDPADVAPAHAGPHPLVPPDAPDAAARPRLALEVPRSRPR